MAKKLISIRIDEDLLDKIDEIRSDFYKREKYQLTRWNVSVADVIEYALKEHFAKIDSK